MNDKHPSASMASRCWLTIEGIQDNRSCCHLAIEDEERLLCSQEFLCKPIAAKLNCDFRNVDHSIRTVIEYAWGTDPGYLAHLASYPLIYPPTVTTQFLDILVSFSLREQNCFLV